MPEINCNADVLSIQNDADASQDDDAVNVSSFRRRCVYAYTLKAIKILFLCTELKQIQHCILFAFIQINDTL